MAGASAGAVERRCLKLFERFYCRNTRGLEEPGSEPSEDIAWCEDQSHLILAVVRAIDPLQRAILSVVRKARARHPNWPVIIAQTGLHELYPPGLSHPAWPVRRSLRHRLEKRAAELVAREARPKADWGTSEREALELVREVARAAQPLSFKDAAAAQTLVLQTIRMVAAHYHPKAARPELALTVPEALLLAEHLARDLRKDILASVPLSQSVTIGTLFRVANAAAKHGPAVKLMYEVADQAWNAMLSFVNPPAELPAS